MTEKLYDLSVKNDDIEMVKINPQRSNTFNWLMENYDTFNNKRNYWKTIAAKLEKLGINNSDNKPYSTSQIKIIWLRVKKAKARETVEKTTVPTNRTQPHQLSSPTLTQSLSPSPFTSSQQKKDTRSPEEIAEGERRAAEETAKILSELKERDKRR